MIAQIKWKSYFYRFSKLEILNSDKTKNLKKYPENITWKYPLEILKIPWKYTLEKSLGNIPWENPLKISPGIIP